MALHVSWPNSKWFRFALIATLVYVALRLVMHIVYLSGTFGYDESSVFNGQFVPSDLRDYLLAAERLENRQDLYLKGLLDTVRFYQYPPSYALAFTIFLRMPPPVIVIVHSLLHVAAYGILYFWWTRMFVRLGLNRASDMMIWTLPVWLVFETFWSDLGLLNIYIIMALWATLFLDAILREDLGWSLLWLSLILQTKPQWAFALAIPLLLGRWRFFLQLVAGAILIYTGIVALTILLLGPTYGWEQYLSYYQFLWNLPANFPWLGPDSGFLGYNHSIAQIVMYLMGNSPTTLRVAMIVKALLLIPLGVLAVRCLRRPANRPGQAAPQLALELAFAFYLAAFIWLDLVWELTLSMVVFVYLLATVEGRGERILIWVAFLPYALLDAWRIVGYLIFPDAVSGIYLLVDPSIYVPIIAITLVTFYTLLLKRFWSLPALRAREAIA